MKVVKTHRQKVAAAKAGMDRKSARKYIKRQGILEEKKVRVYRTRKNPFEAHWDELVTLLKTAPELSSNTLFTWLTERYPGVYQEAQLRTLQRHLQQWRAEYGKDKSIIFLQTIQPGLQSQSDWTCMNALEVTIAGKSFSHLFFHFMLPYSHWESVRLCFSESFDSLILGFEKAVWELGGILPEHRTDNLSAATQREGGTRIFTERWQEFLDYYQVKPSRNNPGESHENGSVEKSHDTFKRAVEQYLLLRGSRDFADTLSYEKFISALVTKRNALRSLRMATEMPLLRELPVKPWCAPTILPVRVTPSSIINILGIPYSVPSRLISYTLRTYVYPEVIEVYYGHRCLQKMPRQWEGHGIDYRHLIDHLVRKPGAFFNYQYQAALFPCSLYRWAFDEFMRLKPSTGHKDYLQLLLMAKLHGEQHVRSALELEREAGTSLDVSKLKLLVDTQPTRCPEVTVLQPSLVTYDSLHAFHFQEINA